MSIPWDFLKLRLAVTSALLMSLSVAVTVIHAARERRKDTVARMGGDEFAILLRGFGQQAVQRRPRVS